MATHYLTLPLSQDERKLLKAGDLVYLSGTLFTARDQAHKRLIESLKKNEILPIDLQSATIYYTGPTPTAPGKISGSVGPTTSYRMDPYAITLMEQGQHTTIGKGERSDAYQEMLLKTNSIYFCAIGGVGALLSKNILEMKTYSYPDLHTEAIHRLEVKDFMVFVGYDTYGNSIFDKPKKK